MRWIGQITYDEVAYFREDVIIEAGNKLGIGTTSPAYTLDVAGIINTNSNYRQGGVKILGRESSNTVLEASGANSLIFETNNNEGVRITETGNVGIGTTSPLARLDVRGSTSGSSASGLIIKNSTGNATLSVRDDGVVQVPTGYFWAQHSNGMYSTGSIKARGGVTNDQGTLGLGGSGSVSALNITSGNVGIGTTTPQQLLDVSAVTGATLRLTSTGDGLGDNAPIGAIEFFGNDASAPGAGVKASITAQTGVSLGDDADLIFKTSTGAANNAETMRIDGSTGYVGIGTSSPGYKLDVTGGGLKTTSATGNKIAYYDGTGVNAYSSSGYKIGNYNGNLTFANNTDDGDVIFQSDNGSGGVATYLTIDGSAGQTRFYKDTRHTDGIKAKFGNADDLQIYHDGTDSIMFNQTGNLFFSQIVDDGDMIFKCDDGSGGTTAYLTLDGGLGYTTVQKRVKFDDNVQLQFGSGGDLQFYHTGGVGVLYNNTGDLTFRQNADDKDIIFQADDGSGGVATYFKLDGSLAAHDGSVNTARYTVWDDNSIIACGTSRDLIMFHTGTSSFLSNYVGNFYIDNNLNDGDIVLRCDDGSGGLTAYLTLDGSIATTKFSKNTMHQDSVKAYFGTGADFEIFHNGSSSYIENNTGNLYIKNEVDDGDIIFQSDDGSGGTQTYLTIDGGLEVVTVPDTIYLGAGTSFDLSLRHDGSNSHIQNNTGDLTIKNTSNDKDIIFQSDDGSGGLATYFFLDGSQAQTIFNVNAQFQDDVRLKVGSGGDIQIKHDGSNSSISNATGHLTVSNSADDADIIFKSDDGSGGTTAYLTLDGSAGYTTAQKQIRFDDNVLATFGTGNDLEIYHNGSNSFINNETGHLGIVNSANDKNIIIKCDDGSGGVTPYVTLDGGDVSTIVNTIKVLMPNLPTSDPSVAGQLWNSSGALRISEG